MWFLFQSILSYISVLLKYMLFDCYLPRKIYIKKIYGYIILLFICVTGEFCKFLLGSLSIGNLIITLGATYIICFVLFNGKFSIKFLLSIIFVFFIITLDLLIAVTINWIFNENLFKEFKGITQTISIILYYTIEFLIIHYLRRKRVKEPLSETGKLYFIQSFIPIVSILFVLLYISSGVKKSTIDVLQCYFIIFIFVAINIIQYIIFVIHERLSIENYNNLIISEKYKMKDIYYKNLEKYQDEIRVIRHDLKNQLITIDYYIDVEDNIKAKQELEMIIEDINKAENTLFTKNIPINVLLNNKYNVAILKDIKVFIDIRIPENINIIDRDILRLLGNAIDNAIEASEKTDNNKLIQIRMYYYNKNILIEIGNSTDGKVRNLQSRKKEKNIHGYGLKSIKSIVEKYNGSMNYYILNNEFKLEINLWELN